MTELTQIATFSQSRIEGTEERDILQGNEVFGNGGNDYLSGTEIGDYLEGNEGNDSLQGNLGNDTLILNPIHISHEKLSVFEPMIVGQVFNFFCHFIKNTTTL